jgi:hypothetical protein
VIVEAICVKSDEAIRFNALTFQRFNGGLVFLSNVLRKNRSSPAPGTKTALDQSAVAIQSGFLFNQGAYF